MLTLITGSLGTGKTALMIKLLTEHSSYPDNAVVVGVREWQGGGAYYTLPGQDVFKNQALIEDIGKLPGTVYVVDEAKKIWPSRIAGKPVPEFIDSHLAESRSIAQDWIFTAQTPTQIDVALRRLIGRHIHLELTPFGVKYSESGQIREDLKFTRDESRKYDFPKDSLKLYRSDDGVTDSHKKGLSVPKRLIYLGILMLVLISVVVYFASNSTIFKSVVGMEDEEIAVTKTTETKKEGISQPQATKAVSLDILPITHAPNHYYYAPRDPAVPELAKAPRIPVGCISSATKCICYDQYNQRIEEISPKRCQDFIDNKNRLAFARDQVKRPEKNQSRAENHPKALPRG